jgi:hypothetical protein
MGSLTTGHDCSLSPSALERTKLMVGKGAYRLRAVPSHSIRSSGSRRFFPSCWLRERRPALMQFAQSSTMNSVRSIAGELRRPSCHVFSVQLEIRVLSP